MPSYRQPGLVLTDHRFEVPLDHADPGGAQIEVYAREVAAADQAGADLPWLIFFQGGPGRSAPRPEGRSGWLDRAVRDYRVLLLDQRGTGRSTPANRRTLASLGPSLGASLGPGASPGPAPDAVQSQAAYLANFRADSIVADAELIRRRLTGGRPWSVLGQSYGGFCAVTYLSRAPEGLTEVLITGGLPGLDATAGEVYRLTYPLAEARNRRHYERYPQDVERARAVARHLAAGDVRLPDGGTLTPENFQALGHVLGMSTGSEILHYLLEDALDGDQIGDEFGHRALERLSFAPGPLYAVLHEACYAQETATMWSAQRTRANFPQFSAATALDGDEPVLFTGEMIYPWMFTADPVLRPLAGAAELLAAKPDWPRLYDPVRLAANEVPVAAAIYHDDMYVPRELSLATAARIRGLRYWVTSEYDHDGLRVSDGAVLDRLIAMARGMA